MSDISDYRSIPDTTNEYQSELNKPKTSGLKQPSGIPSLSKVSRLCSSHDKKPELPPAATPKKSEYLLSYPLDLILNDHHEIHHVHLYKKKVKIKII